MMNSLVYKLAVSVYGDNAEVEKAEGTCVRVFVDNVLIYQLPLVKLVRVLTEELRVKHEQDRLLIDEASQEILRNS